MRKILGIIFLGLVPVLYAQETVCLGDDVEVCQGTPVTIDLCSSIDNTIFLNNPQVATFTGDDEYGALLPLGFTFNFYGTNYTNAIVSDNGTISFNTSNANNYCAYSTINLPSNGTASILNSALLCWQDLYFPANNTNYYYQTIGTAPNRIFVVAFSDVQYYSSSCQTNEICFTAAALFYETTNVIEFHISNKSACTSWNGGNAVQGLINSSGANAHIVTGRNNSVWEATNDGKRFTPTAPNNYTIEDIPFTFVQAGANALVWSSTVNPNQTLQTGGNSLLVNNPPVGTTGYFISSSTCGVPVDGLSDTTWITVNPVNATTTTTPDFCNASQGSATVNPTAGAAPFTYLWTPGGSTSNTITNLSAGLYSVQITDANGCSTTKNATVVNTNPTYSVSSTQVSCPGGINGTATATMTPNIGNVSYLWSNGQTTATATNLAAGTYTVDISSDAGCNQTLSVEVTEIPGMIASVTSFTDVTCHSHNDGTINISVSQGTSPYTYVWDQSSSMTNSADDLAKGTHTITIKDVNDCSIQVTQEIQEPSALSISFLTPDTQICPEDNIELVVNGAGGSSAYLYEWASNANILSNDSTVVVDPEFTNTDYCITLRETCGSPEVTECVTITFPTPIEPALNPDTLIQCSPGTFVFDNTSSNGGEIAYSYYEFDDQAVALREGADTISHTFRDPGFHSVILTTTSIYGCVYTDTFPDIVNVLPIPVADFSFSKNPTTIFETIIMCQDRSTSDVINWEWISDDSYPTSSSLENPKFEFPDGKLGQYPVTLIVSSENGCYDTITKVLHVIEDVLFFAPNAFTPDNDEFNQSWKFHVEGIDIYQFEIKIYNRWGELIWESHDPASEWDGTFNGRLVPAGTYVWIATAKSIRSDEKINFNGTINLLR